MSEYIIEMQNITKKFPGIIANDNITLNLKRGEVHSLLGENGAGKSTLMSVLFGLYTPEQGVIKKDDKEINISNPNDANRYGIGMVHQHFKLVDVFTVLQNIILGVEPNSFGFLTPDKARNKVIELSQKYGLYVDVDALVMDISVGMQQRVEILKMLYRDNDILIFDEPTAVLTPQEITELMNIIKNLKSEGKSILFISHKLNEIMEISDRVTVLRKGKLIGTVNASETNKLELSKMMVGREIDLVQKKTQANPKEVILRCSNLTVASTRHNNNAVKGISFEAKAGEILCIAGIEGNGQTELVYALSGLSKVKSGDIFFNEENITKKTIKYRNMMGISHIPEDRHKHGLVLDYSLENNLVLQQFNLAPFHKYGFIQKEVVRDYAHKLIKQYDIRSGQGPITPTRSMSGGNQQKAIVAREIERSPKLILAVQPTRGLDIGAIAYIHQQLIKERDEGKSVLLVSLELDEVMNLSDRIILMYEGEIVAELDPQKITVQELGLYMSGAKRNVFQNASAEGGDLK